MVHLLFLLILRLLSWWHLPQIQGNQRDRTHEKPHFLDSLALPLQAPKKRWEFRQKQHKETESRGHLDLMMMCFKHVFAAFLGNILKSHNQKTWMTKSFCNICLFIHLTSSWNSFILDELCAGKKRASECRKNAWNSCLPPGAWCRDISNKHQESLKKHGNDKPERKYQYWVTLKGQWLRFEVIYHWIRHRFLRNTSLVSVIFCFFFQKFMCPLGKVHHYGHYHPCYLLISMPCFFQATNRPVIFPGGSFIAYTKYGQEHLESQKLLGVIFPQSNCICLFKNIWS